MYPLKVRELTITIPQRVLCDKISFQLKSGSKTALVANNGAGKTTLLKTIAGERESEAGEIKRHPDVTIGYLPQTPQFDPDATVLDTLIAHDNETGQLILAYERALTRGDDALLERTARQIEARQARDFETKVNIVINKLQLHELLDQQVNTCSGGEVKRLQLARLLLEDPDVLLLDEPTNHLDVEMIERLETYLHRANRTILVVTHDRYFIDRVCDQIIELDQGVLHTYPADYEQFLELKETRLEVEMKRAHKQKQRLRQELARMRKAPRARETKSSHRAQQVDALQADYKQATRNLADKHSPMEISVADRRIGGKIVNIHNLTKSYGEKVLIKDFSYTFRNGERVALIGKNGTGKTTLLNMIVGTVQPDSGHIVRGDTITIALYQQQQQQIDNSLRVIDVVKQGAEYITVADGKRLSASQLLELFQFSPHQQQQRAYTLSGGEKRRLHLLTVLIANPNFLILDEPTNDLDIMSMTVLENFLRSYGGCLVVVSHDRYFIDRVADHLLVCGDDGSVTEFPGNYTDRAARQHAQQDETESSDTSSSSSNQEPVKRTSTNTSLSNKEREEFHFLGAEIERLEERKLAINGAITQTTDHQEIKGLSTELAQIAQQLEGYETRWLELAERGGR